MSQSELQENSGLKDALEAGEVGWGWEAATVVQSRLGGPCRGGGKLRQCGGAAEWDGGRSVREMSTLSGTCIYIRGYITASCLPPRV